MFLVRDINSGEHLAVKRLRVSDKEQFTAAKKEINIMVAFQLYVPVSKQCKEILTAPSQPC